MDDRNAQVGWTEAQWNRVREEVLQAWQRVRVAGSFLPIYGPLPPSTQVVPSEVLKDDDGSVDDRATAALVEIALPVRLSRQQIWEEDLSSALLQFRRRATQLGQLEDWYIFNGTFPSIKPAQAARPEFLRDKDGLPAYRPELAHLNADPSQRARISGTPKLIKGLNHDDQVEGMRWQNPGSLGLIGGSSVEQQQNAAKVAQALQPQLDNNSKMQAIIVDAINSLEKSGYVAPYVCVFGRIPFQEAFTPVNNTTVLPRDRIEPLIGRELLHASGIDIPPYEPGQWYDNPNTGEWPKRGVLFSMANEPIDLAVAVEATPEFRQVNLDGKYVFSVFERFALRIKDVQAIVPLMFEFL